MVAAVGLTPCKWLAHFADGTALAQFQDGREHSLHQVARDQVVALTIFYGAEPRLTVKINSGEPWFYRKRTCVTLGGEQLSMHFVGVQRQLDGQPAWLLWGVFEGTGEVQHVKGFQANNWFHAPEFLPHESAAQGQEVRHLS